MQKGSILHFLMKLKGNMLEIFKKEHCSPSLHSVQCLCGGPRCVVPVQWVHVWSIAS